MTKDNRNGLIFLGVVVLIVILVCKKSPVLQAESKKNS
jgi:hypothetical protein